MVYVVDPRKLSQAREPRKNRRELPGHPSTQNRTTVRKNSNVLFRTRKMILHICARLRRKHTQPMGESAQDTREPCLGKQANMQAFPQERNSVQELSCSEKCF